MEKVELIAYAKRVRKRFNEFYELCKFYSDVWNAAPGQKVLPNRFFRDCKANRRAYELAKIDYVEITAMEDFKHNFKEPEAKAKLLFGRLKGRKAELNGK